MTNIDTIQRPKVGLGVYIINNKDEILLQKRQNAHGEGTWSAPGGHLEFGESFAQCAVRETLEEVGIEITSIQVIGLTNDIFEENKHYITIAMCAKLKSGQPKIMEPDKILEIGWFKIGSFPSPLFLPFQNLLKTDFDCFCGSGSKYQNCHQVTNK